MSKDADRYTVRRRRFAFLLLVALGALLYALVLEVGTQRETPYSTSQPGSEVEHSQDHELAVRVLGKLAVREAVSGQDYDRNEFGAGWAEVEGCDMRNIMLQQYLKDYTLADDGCVVLTGSLRDAYTGKTVAFQRGSGTSGDVQIDHVVALSDAWRKGAQELTLEQRAQFANDPLNLIAVEGDANLEKSDSDASEWLPHKPFRCRYVARQIAVKAKYGLWVTREEYNAMVRTLGGCPGQVLPIENAL